MTKQRDDYVHLHTHCDQSAFDGLGTPADFVKRAAELGQPGIGITDHGTVRAVYDAGKAAQEAGITFVPGCEFYMVDDATRKGLSDEQKKELQRQYPDKAEQKEARKALDRQLRERDHVTVWALDDRGLSNLYKLASWSWTHGFYYKPRIDFDRLVQHGEGLLIGSGCIGTGTVLSPLLNGNPKTGIDRAAELADAFPGRFVVEVMPHNIEGREGTHQQLARIAETLEVPLVATYDAHYPNKADADAQQALLCIQTRKRLRDPDRLTMDPVYWLTTRAEMLDAFSRNVPALSTRVVNAALDQTMAIAERCTAQVRDAAPGAYLVAPDLPDGVKSYRTWLINLCREGVRHRFGADLPDQYVDRLSHELRTICGQGYARYFVAVWDLCYWARREGILCGPGRGSAAGCLVSYLLQITDLDPVEHRLSFERFMSPGRCMPPGTVVSTPFGPVPIEDLSPGDYVLTSRGPRPLVATHSRNTESDEGLIEIKYGFGRASGTLLCTPEHSIIQNVGDKIDKAPAHELVEGGNVHELRGLRNTISAEDLEPSRVQYPMPNPRPSIPETQEGLSVVRRVVRRTQEAENMLPKVWKVAVGSDDVHTWPGWDAQGSRTLRAVVTGGRFCAVADSARVAVCVRTQSVLPSERANVHAGFLGAGSSHVLRTEGVEGAGRGKTGGCEESSQRGRRESGGALSAGHRSNVRKEQRRRGRSEPGADRGHPVQAQQDRGSSVRSVWQNLQSPTGAKEQNVWSIVREYLETVEARTGGGVSPDLENVRRMRDPLLGVSKQHCDQNALLQTTSPATITRIRRIPYSGIVYDLTVHEHHEYFANGILVGNSDLPDIDVDFPRSRRADVIQYLRDTYGDDRVAHISTYNRLRGKETLRSLARVYSLPEFEVAPLASLFDGSEDAPDDIGAALDSTQVGADFTERYPGIAKVARRLEGNLRSVGSHASGVVVADRPLFDVAPVETRTEKGSKSKRVWAVAYDMHGAEDAGLVKLDVLGLKTLDVIRIALDLAGASVDDIEPEHPDVLAAFSRGEFGGVFQYDTPSARKLCKGVTFKTFGDVAVMTALNRPGPKNSGLADQYIARAADPSKIKPVHPVWDQVFADTYGVPVYQEQVVQLARDMAGYDAEHADKFRKKISKKTGLDDEEDGFCQGAVARGVTDSQARQVFQQLVGFARYAFNRAHAFSYAQVACWCQWLRVNYPGPFFAAALSLEDKAEKRIALAGDARRAGIPVLPPNVNTSGVNFRFAGDVIVGSLTDVDKVGPKAAEVITAGQPFDSLQDLYNRTAGAGNRAVTAGTFAALSKATAIRDLCPHTRFLVANAKKLWANLRRGKAPDVSADLPDYTDDQLVQVVSSAWPPYLDSAEAEEADQVETQVRQQFTRWLATVDMIGDAPGAHTVFGRVQGVRYFQDDHGVQHARISLGGSDGSELTARVDADVLERAPDLAERPLVVALTLVDQKGRCSIDAIWTADQVLQKRRKGAKSPTPDDDTLLHVLCTPPKTRPRNPGLVVSRSREGRSFPIEGWVVRRRQHWDKNGGRMLTIGLLGSAGYARFFVFASRRPQPDVKHLIRGRHVVVRLRKLSGDAACLGRAKVQV